jgi:Ca2+-binding RTX toxin-like protein
MLARTDNHFMKSPIEYLERRSLLSVLPMLDPIPGVAGIERSRTGTMTIRMTRRDDVIDVSAGSLLQVAMRMVIHRQPATPNPASTTGALPVTADALVVHLVSDRGADKLLFAQGADAPTGLIHGLRSVSGQSDDAALLIESSATGSEPLVIMRGAFRRLKIDLQPGNDRVTLTSTLLKSRPITVMGGAGDDQLTGGNSITTLDGGAGNDLVSEAGILLGGPGRDYLNDGIVADGGADFDWYFGRLPQRLSNIEWNTDEFGHER